MATALPTYDYEGEQQALLRQMKIAEAMQAQGMAPPAPTEMVSGVAVKQSPFAGLAKVAQAYLGRQAVQTVDDQRKQLGQRYAAEGKAGVEHLLDGMSQQPMAADGSGPPVPQAMLQEGKRRAIIEAMGSQHPQVHALGQAMMKSLTEGQLTPKDMAAYATPESVIQGNGNPAAFKPKVELTAAQPGDLFYDKGGNFRTPGTPPAGPGAGGAGGPGSMPFGIGTEVPKGWKVEGQGQGYDLIRDPAGDLYQRSASGLKKLDNAPKVSNNVKITNVGNAGESAFAKKLGELNAEELGKIRASGDTARKMQPILRKLDSMTNSPTFQGPTSNVGIWMAELANSIGVPVDKNKLATSEEYKGILAKQISNYLTAGSGVGRSLTDADRQKLEEQFPALIASPEGRRRIIQTLWEANQRDIGQADEAEALVKQKFPELARLTPGGYAAPPAPQLPNTRGGAQGKPTVSNWPGAR